MVVTWTAVFRLAGMKDTPQEVGQAVNGLVGAHLNRALREGLRKRGWHFEEALPEDHGWHATARMSDGSKLVDTELVTCPELDAATADGGAEEDRWRIVIGLDPGWLPSTKSRRAQLLDRLAADTEGACRDLGATALDWEVGGPAS